MGNPKEKLIDSLVVVSLPYEKQLEHFPNFVDVFDEVISDFDNAFQFIPVLMDENVISYEAVKEVIRCYNLMTLNLTIEERLTDESFKNDTSWNLVREYAKNALKVIS